MAMVAIAAVVGVGIAYGSYLLSNQSSKQKVEGSRLGSSNLTTSTEGAGLARLYGRQRLDGQVIWATQFKETVTTTTSEVEAGGKATSSKQEIENTDYTYSISVAIAFCEGNEKTDISRVWADGKPIALSDLNYRFYPGSPDQMPDEKIEEIEGIGEAPAYRGTAYIVIEDLALADFGNRLPQITAEIIVPMETDDPVDIQNSAEAFTLIPSSGESAYATTQYDIKTGTNKTKADNVHNSYRVADAKLAMDQLIKQAENLDVVSITVAWFGNDLRAGHCLVRPMIEDAGREMYPAWHVGLFERDNTDQVSRDDEDRPNFGGTPGDSSVIELIQHLKSKGKRVVFYPFVLMDIKGDNTLPNPYSDNAAEVGQAAFPWRGRITCSPAPDYAGTADKTGTAATQINNFFDEYDAMVEHYADLCDAAGGVDGFILGSELIGLTTSRDALGSYPAVDRLIGLAAAVKGIVGSGTDVTYAADWAEWTHNTADGLWFHLDPLWANANIDAIGVDNYLPLSDWRDGTDHLDYDAVNGPVSPYEPMYLASQIEGGEYYDYYYASAADRDNQVRSPITDGVYGNDWVYKIKDFTNWWRNSHHNIPNGLMDNMIIDGGDPSSFYSTGGTIIPSAEVYGPYSDAIELVSNGGSIDRVSSAFMLGGIKAGRKYYAYIIIKRDPNGTNEFNRFRIRIPTTGPLGLLEVRCLGGEFEPYDLTGLLDSFGAVDLGGGFTRVEMRFTAIINDASVYIQVSPWSTTIGDSIAVIAVGCIQEFSNNADVSATAWVPESKPIWFTEFGAPAIDKGTNQPNVFYDPKSSESAYPYYSTEKRDDFIQRVAVETMLDYWRNNSPDAGGLTMVEPKNMFIWTWDARPFPDYPNRIDVWSDGAHWFKGHWWNGRIDAVPLHLLVRQLCLKAGVSESRIDVSGLYGPDALVRGYQVDRPEPIRQTIEALMSAYLFDGFESEGKIKFVMRSNTKVFAISGGDFVVSAQDPVGVMVKDGQETDLPTKVNVTFVDEFKDYNSGAVDGKTSRGYSQNIEELDFMITLTGAYARALADTIVQQRWTERKTGKMTLPPSLARFDPGDALVFPVGSDNMTGRLTAISIGAQRDCEFTAFDPETFILPEVEDEETIPIVADIFGAADIVFLDLPLFTGSEVYPWAPRVAADASPWPGTVNVYKLLADTTYKFNMAQPYRSSMGRLNVDLPDGPTAVWDTANTINITLDYGALYSVTEIQALGGTISLGIHNSAKDEWEVIQFSSASLVGENTYEITNLLRGQLGTEQAMGALQFDRVVVLQPQFLSALLVSDDTIAETNTFSWGPGKYPQTDDTYLEGDFSGKRVGLRPYSPTSLKLSINPAGDLILTWLRRTRFGGDGWAVTNPPLNEENEAYRIRVYDGATVVREIETTVETYTYSIADQVTDFGAQQNQLQVDVAQFGAHYGGYGTPRPATLNIGKATL